MTKLTDNQSKVLVSLTDGPMTAKRIAAHLDSLAQKTHYWSVIWTYDQVHSILRRLEDRNLVRRISDPPTQWELTSLGKKAIKDN